MEDRQENDGSPMALKQLALEILRSNTEVNATKCSVQKLSTDVLQLSLEIEEDRIDRKWSFDKDGKRVLSDPTSEAWRIAKQLRDNPDLLPDVLDSLNQKLTKNRMENNVLRQKCNPR